MPEQLAGEALGVALCMEGTALSDKGDMPGALAHYQAAVEAAPGVLSLYLILSNAQALSGDTLGARATLRTAARVSSRFDLESEFTLGRALVDAGAGADAVRCFRRVSAELPRDAGAAAALAAALRDAQQPVDAWREVQRALRLAPNDPVAALTAAQIRHDLADYEGAMAWCEKSLALRPDSSGARVTRGYLRHLTSDSRGGWSDFEARPLPAPRNSVALWRGESLSGRSILVLGEQGVGDQFQFLRFVMHPALQAATRVVVAVQRDAVLLLRASGYDAVARDDVVQTDVYVPLLSLPLLLEVDADWRAELEAPYLVLPESLQRRRGAIKRVGVVWAGNPAHRNDAVRSIPAAAMHGLLQAHPSLTFVCMQHDVRDVDLPIDRWERPRAGDWLATARELCTLDLLITVDTGIAHLAGALGIPVWILLPHVPDWRWGTGGQRTPWYAAARLFRQPARGDWSRVITNVSAALAASVLVRVTTTRSDQSTEIG